MKGYVQGKGVGWNSIGRRYFRTGDEKMEVGIANEYSWYYGKTKDWEKEADRYEFAGLSLEAKGGYYEVKYTLRLSINKYSPNGMMRKTKIDLLEVNHSKRSCSLCHRSGIILVGNRVMCPCGLNLTMNNLSILSDIDNELAVLYRDLVKSQ